MKSDHNPMQRAHEAPRCSAKSKRTGLNCRSPAVKGYSVCRMHGARGGAPKGKNNGNFSKGLRSQEIKKLIKDNRRLITTVRDKIQKMEC